MLFIPTPPTPFKQINRQEDEFMYTFTRILTDQEFYALDIQTGLRPAIKRNLMRFLMAEST